MLLLSIHHFGRFFFLQIYVLWSVVGSDGFSPSEPSRFPHRSWHSPPLQPDPAKMGIRPGSSSGSRCTLPPSVALRGSRRYLSAWTFLAAVADSPVFLTAFTRFQSFFLCQWLQLCYRSIIFIFLSFCCFVSAHWPQGLWMKHVASYCAIHAQERTPLSHLIPASE